MPRERRIVVYIATSADGFIARPDGGIDWLQTAGPPTAYGLTAFFKTVDTILWGRKTYDQSLGMGGLDIYGAKVKHYVFSHRPLDSPPGVERIDEPVREFAARLRAQPGKDVWMMGGGELIASFLDAGEIDAFIVHTLPVLIGEGIPLVAPKSRLVPLDLRSVRRFKDGVLRLHYDVRRTIGDRPQKE